jgi:DNA-binding transcriptional LysR family regulator
MDTRSLKHFLVLAEELHFGRAAARLCISQPPLTKHIQQFELELGVRLFDRNKRSVRLTPAGVTLVAEARRLLAQSERAVRMVQRAERGDGGRVRIGFVAAVLFMGIETALMHIEGAIDGLVTVWEEMGTSEQLAALEQDRIDLGFAQVSQSVGDLASHVVASVPLVVAIPGDHRLSAAPSIDLADLSDDAFIAIPRESAPRYHDLTVAACMNAGYSPTIAHTAKHLVSMVSLVAMGRGVALVPASFERAGLPGVLYKPIEHQVVRAEYSVVWNPRSELAVLPRVLALLGVPGK